MAGIPAPTIIDMGRRRASGTRAKDSDRISTCLLLDTALADGQLPMDEHHRRVSVAMQAPTLGELEGLVTDLQLPEAPRRNYARWAIAAAVTAGAVVLGVLGWGALTRDAPEGTAQTADSASIEPDRAQTADAPQPAEAPPTADAAPTAETPTGPRWLHSVDGVNGLFEQIRDKFGDTRGYELSIYTDYARLTRMDADDDRFEAKYRYEAGTWEGPARSPNSDGSTIDLSAFDVAAVLGVVRGAGETMEVEPNNLIMVYFTVEPADDPTAPDAVTVRVHVSTSFGGGLIELDGAGNVKRVDKPF
jgi:hypothetical protein